MDLSELKTRVMRAVDTLYARDSDLFERDASEWSIAHRLAVYLEYELPGWNVDCEYNRQGPGIAPKKGWNQESNECDKNVRPDISVHHRGRFERDHNLLVIELKKKAADSDLKKACEYTNLPTPERPYQYQFGLTLSVIDGPKMQWSENGKKNEDVQN